MTLLLACMVTGSSSVDSQVALASGVDTGQPAAEAPEPLPAEVVPPAEPQDAAAAASDLAAIARAFAEAKAAQDATTVEQSTEVTP